MLSIALMLFVSQADSGTPKLTKAEFIATVEEQVKTNGPMIDQAIAVRLCRSSWLKKEAEGVLKSQKDAAKIGGVIDKEIVYDASQRIIETKAEISEIKTVLKRRGWKQKDIAGLPATCAEDGVIKKAYDCAPLPDKKADFSEQNALDGAQCNEEYIRLVLALAQIHWE